MSAICGATRGGYGHPWRITGIRGIRQWTTEDYKPVKPPRTVSCEHQMGRRVHVEGWPKGYHFIYRKTVDGLHYLRTPTSKRDYTTRNRLLETRAQKRRRETEAKHD